MTCPHNTECLQHSAPLILDACCGGRMMWTNKKEPHTIFTDIRKANKGHIQNGFNPNHEVKPNIIMDYRAMAFKPHTFNLIFFDPPHLSSLTETSIMRKKFGVLNSETWQYDIQKAFLELWALLKPNGILIFKWNDIEIPYKTVLKLLKKKPIVQQITAGQKALKNSHRSYWFTFIKTEGNQ